MFNYILNSAAVFYPTVITIKLKKLVEIIGSFVTFLYLLPVILVLIGLNELVRFILNTYIQWSSKGQIFLNPSGPDGVWGFEKAADPSTCTFMLILKGKGNLENIRKYFQANVMEKKDEFGRHPFNKLKQTLVTRFGYYCWKKNDDFELANHIKYLDEVVQNPNDVVKESQLNGIFARLTNEMLDSSKPQWENLLIPNFKYEDEGDEVEAKHYAVIARMHHTIGDAISWLHLIMYGMADNNNKIQMSVDPLAPLSIPKWKIYMAYFMVFILGPRSIFKFFTAPEKNLIHTRNELTGPKYTHAQTRTTRFKLETLKRIKDRSQTSVTAVITSCLGGGLRKYLIEKGENPPMEITSITTGAMLPYPDYKPKNRFSIVPFPLATGLEKPEERLEASFQATLNFYRGPDLPLFYFVTVFVGRLPTFLISMIWRLGHATVVFSNIPGPLEKLTLFGGDLVVDAYGFTPIKCYTGISMSSLSYAGHVRLSLLGDHEAIKSNENCKRLLEHIEDEFEALAQKYCN